MNKPLVVTLLTSAILTLAAPAIGASPNVSVTGGGTIVDDDNGTTVHVTISARRPADAPDEAGSGNVTIKFPGEPAVHGTVDCLTGANGPTAALTGELDNGLFFRIAVNDGEQAGVPDRGQAEVDTAPFTCQTRGGGGSEIINGNFQVRG